MPHRKVLSDLVSSAGSAKAHFEVWWALESEAKPALVETMQAHSDFFRASSDAHYNALFTYLAHLYDKRSDASSIKNYLRLAAQHIPANRHLALTQEHEALLTRATPLVDVRVRIPRHGGHDSTLMADSVPASCRTPFHAEGGQHSKWMADT